MTNFHANMRPHDIWPYICSTISRTYSLSSITEVTRIMIVKAGFRITSWSPRSWNGTRNLLHLSLSCSGKYSSRASTFFQMARPHLNLPGMALRLGVYKGIFYSLQSENSTRPRSKVISLVIFLILVQIKFLAPKKFLSKKMLWKKILGKKISV